MFDCYIYSGIYDFLFFHYFDKHVFYKNILDKNEMILLAKHQELYKAI